MNLDHVERAKTQWQFIVDAIPLLLFLIDRHGRIIRANRTLERWGLGDVSTIKDGSLHRTLHPGCTATDCYLVEFERQTLSDIAHKRRGQVEAYDPILQRHVEIKFLSTVSEVEHPDLEDVLVVVSVEDISETKRAEKRISQMEDNLRKRIFQETTRRIEIEAFQARLFSLISKTSNFVAMAATDGTLLYLNHSGCVMLQLEECEVAKGMNIFDCLTPEAKSALRDEVLPAAIRNGIWTGSSELLGRHGHRVPTSQVIISHRDPDGQFDGFSIVEQDMTAWIQSEAALRRSQEDLRELSAQLIKVQEDERQRIAADLHDVIGQSVSLVKLSIDNAAEMISNGAAEDAKDALRNLSVRVKDVLVEIRKISMDLHPALLDDLGILPTLSWYFREFESVCASIKVIKTINANENEIPAVLKTTIFRLLQEAMTNIVKHSGANEIQVGLICRAGLLQLTVADNGQGFDTNSCVKGDSTGGLGLRSMKERTRLSGGNYAIDSGTGQGTCIRVSWPIVSAVSD